MLFHSSESHFNSNQVLRQLIVVHRIDWKPYGHWKFHLFVFVATRTKHSRARERKKRTNRIEHPCEKLSNKIPFFQLGKIGIAIIWFICCIKFNCQLYVTVKQNVIPNSRYNNLLLSPDLFWLHTNWVGRTHAVFSSFLISFFMKKIVYLFVCLWVWFNANGRRPNWSEEYLQMP